MKKKVQAEKQKMSEEKRKLYYEQTMIAKVVPGAGTEEMGAEERINSLKSDLEKKFLPKIHSLKEQLDAAYKKFENLQEVWNFIHFLIH